VIAGALSQQAAKHVDVLRQVSIANRFVRPYAYGQRLFVDDASVCLNQLRQNEAQTLG